VEDIVPIVERGLADDTVAADDSDTGASRRNRLVEYNVHEQVSAALATAEGAETDVYGFVYDFHQAYGDRDGVAYLVNANGERDPAALRDLVGDERTDHVATLL
jgi:carbonic anhydrase